MHPLDCSQLEVASLWVLPHACKRATRRQAENVPATCLERVDNLNYEYDRYPLSNSLLLPNTESQIMHLGMSNQSSSRAGIRLLGSILALCTPLSMSASTVLEAAETALPLLGTTLCYQGHIYHHHNDEH